MKPCPSCLPEPAMVVTPKGVGNNSMHEVRSGERETIVAWSQIRAMMSMVKAKLLEFQSGDLTPGGNERMVDTLHRMLWTVGTYVQRSRHMTQSLYGEIRTNGIPSLITTLSNSETAGSPKRASKPAWRRSGHNSQTAEVTLGTANVSWMGMDETGLVTIVGIPATQVKGHVLLGGNGFMTMTSKTRRIR
jgi:hypothetical protein